MRCNKTKLSLKLRELLPSRLTPRHLPPGGRLGFSTAWAGACSSRILRSEKPTSLLLREKGDHANGAKRSVSWWMRSCPALRTPHPSLAKARATFPHWGRQGLICSLCAGDQWSPLRICYKTKKQYKTNRTNYIGKNSAHNIL